MYIEEKLKNLPDSPGVYIMKNEDAQIIYVGKAISLKNRVRQYFNSSKNHTNKVKAMVSNIYDFEYIITDSEAEALILECNLIKNHRPKYNILLRDDKTYPYIKITSNEQYPRILKVRSIIKDKAKYFGPYTNAYALNETLDTIKEIYPIRKCNYNIQRLILKRERPCLNYYIGKCLGPCTGRVDKELYKQMIQEIELILSGKEQKLMDKLKHDMDEASQNLEFEIAAKYRDKIQSIEQIIQKQKIVNVNSDIDQDVISIAKICDEACIQVFFIRCGKIIGSNSYIFNDVFDVSKDEIILSFVKQFYNTCDFIPKEIILSHELKETNLIENWLSMKKEKKVTLRVPQIGSKKELLNLVTKNAHENLLKNGSIKKIKYRQMQDVLEKLKNMLNLKKIPLRIESFDISNIQGTDNVGCMVVFENAIKSPKEYRRYKINTHTPNDYRDMSDIICRRLKNGNHPDLILLDGGIGHVNVIQNILDDMKLDIPLWGMYKDNNHKTKGLISKHADIILDKNSSEYRFIASIQEEAHRFAISYHRSVRNERLTKSILDDIKGVGNKRKKNLISHFKTIDNIKNASVKEMQLVEGINKDVAQNIYDFFRRND